MDAATFLVDFDGLWLCTVVGGIVGLASVAPPGWFVPGQTFAIGGGAIAAAGGPSLPMVALSVFLGANLGSAVGYALGALLSAKKPGWANRGRPGRWWSYAAEMLDQRTAAAIITGRWNAALRACIPNAAGACQIGWRRFLRWNTLACALWSPAVVGAGALIERTALIAQAALGMLSAVVFLGVAAFLIIGYHRWAATRSSADRPQPVGPPDTATLSPKELTTMEEDNK